MSAVSSCRRDSLEIAEETLNDYLGKVNDYSSFIASVMKNEEAKEKVLSKFTNWKDTSSVDKIYNIYEFIIHLKQFEKAFTAKKMKKEPLAGL